MDGLSSARINVIECPILLIKSPMLYPPKVPHIIFVKPLPTHHTLNKEKRYTKGAHNQNENVKNKVKQNANESGNRLWTSSYSHYTNPLCSVMEEYSKYAENVLQKEEAENHGHDCFSPRGAKVIPIIGKICNQEQQW